MFGEKFAIFAVRKNFPFINPSEILTARVNNCIIK